MAEIPDHIRQTVDELKGNLLPLVTEVQNSLVLINLMEQRYGLPLTTLEDLAQDAEGAGQPPRETALGHIEVRPRGPNIGAIRPDQYLGHPPLDAAKIYLAQLGHAASIDDITAAVQKGGAAIDGPKWKESLEMSLLRSVYDVIKVQEHTFGLIKFYTPEQINRLRGTRRQIPSKKKKKRKTKSAKLSQPASERSDDAKKPSDPPAPTVAQIERMKELRKAGKSLAEIGKEFGLHHLAVFQLTGGKAGKPANAV